jgi:hypothetical protein
LDGDLNRKSPTAVIVGIIAATASIVVIWAVFSYFAIPTVDTDTMEE